jgi:hypothetical protein
MQIGSDVSGSFQIGAGVQTETRAAQNNSPSKAYWLALRPCALGRGSLVAAACTFQLAFRRRWLPRGANSRRFSSISLPQPYSPEPPLPLARCSRITSPKPFWRRRTSCASRLARLEAFWSSSLDPAVRRVLQWLTSPSSTTQHPHLLQSRRLALEIQVAFPSASVCSGQHLPRSQRLLCLTRSGIIRSSCGPSSTGLWLL